MRPRPVIVLWRTGGRWRMSHRVPSRIVRCRTRRDLDGLLVRYGDPRQIPNNVAARRRYVEEVRPALRWYCRVFNVPVPPWLLGNGLADGTSDAERVLLFGPEPLRVREFLPMPETPGR